MEIGLIIFNIILSIIGIPMIMKLLVNNGIVALNYKNEKIPMPLGLIFIFIQLISLLILILFNNDIVFLLYLIGILTMGLIGLLDDLAGDTEVKGLKGHIKSFFKGKLTTGFIKASVGMFLSIIISIKLSKTIPNIILNTFIISLSINALNLFDLRPGRSLKVFIFLSILFLLIFKFNNYFIILSMLSISVIYFYYDIKAKSMMGDTGSNVLGFTVGYYVILNQDLVVRVVYLVLLVTIHIIAEKVSISKIIENNKFLKYIDELGR